MTNCCWLNGKVFKSANLKFYPPTYKDLQHSSFDYYLNTSLEIKTGFHPGVG